MTRSLLILRPEPGAAATAARAAALGLGVTTCPLFTVRATAWEAPDPADFDALMLTSANALRHGGRQLALYRDLPVHAVGDATAAAARGAGFTAVTAGARDGEALLDQATAAGATRLLHLTGREHRPATRTDVLIERRIVYAAEAADHLPPEAETALHDGAIALLHSPRAGGLFRRLAEAAGLSLSSIRVAAISPAALAAAGSGWGAAVAAPAPTDDALLAAAARLCE